ncbi:uncharacterized protein LOC125283299 [Ursus arctos]|uniref:uncharacterized protein LOC125283299 n=1 Tax=Ursus arctos TaxID=9644 RepID=UPI002017C7D7|nr:uncharacterized protein LOC125283299 [Ursus arctos]
MGLGGGRRRCQFWFCRSFGPLRRPAPSPHRWLRTVCFPSCRAFLSLDDRRARRRERGLRSRCEPSARASRLPSTLALGCPRLPPPLPGFPPPPTLARASASGRARACLRAHLCLSACLRAHPCRSVRVRAPAARAPLPSSVSVPLLPRIPSLLLSLTLVWHSHPSLHTSLFALSPLHPFSSTSLSLLPAPGSSPLPHTPSFWASPRLCPSLSCRPSRSPHSCLPFSPFLYFPSAVLPSSAFLPSGCSALLPCPAWPWSLHPGRQQALRSLLPPFSPFPFPPPSRRPSYPGCLGCSRPLLQSAPSPCPQDRLLPLPGLPFPTKSLRLSPSLSFP